MTMYHRRIQSVRCDADAETVRRRAFGRWAETVTHAGRAPRRWARETAARWAEAVRCGEVGQRLAEARRTHAEALQACRPTVGPTWSTREAEKWAREVVAHPRSHLRPVWDVTEVPSGTGTPTDGGEVEADGRVGLLLRDLFRGLTVDHRPTDSTVTSGLLTHAEACRPFVTSWARQKVHNVVADAWRTSPLGAPTEVSSAVASLAVRSRSEAKASRVGPVFGGVVPWTPAGPDVVGPDVEVGVTFVPTEAWKHETDGPEADRERFLAVGEAEGNAYRRKRKGQGPRGGMTKASTPSVGPPDVVDLTDDAVGYALGRLARAACVDAEGYVLLHSRARVVCGPCGESVPVSDLADRDRSKCPRCGRAHKGTVTVPSVTEEPDLWAEAVRRNRVTIEGEARWPLADRDLKRFLSRAVRSFARSRTRSRETACAPPTVSDLLEALGPIGETVTDADGLAVGVEVEAEVDLLFEAVEDPRAREALADLWVGVPEEVTCANLGLWRTRSGKRRPDGQALRRLRVSGLLSHLRPTVEAWDLVEAEALTSAQREAVSVLRRGRDARSVAREVGLTETEAREVTLEVLGLVLTVTRREARRLADREALRRWADREARRVRSIPGYIPLWTAREVGPVTEAEAEARWADLQAEADRRLDERAA